MRFEMKHNIHKYDYITKVYFTRVGRRGVSIEISGFPYSFSFGFSGNERRNFIGNLFLGKL